MSATMVSASVSTSTDRSAARERGVPALDAFLAGVEKRAFAMARALLGDREEALDAVQDSMLLLVRRYRNRSEEEWPPLFYRILHNRVRDLQRRRAVRNRFRSWLSTGGDPEEPAPPDPFQQVPDPVDGNPIRHLADERSMEALEYAIRQLPSRQQQAFLLRCWEGLDTSDTAVAMRCSQGSVKTHYARALHRLRQQLEEHRDD